MQDVEWTGTLYAVKPGSDLRHLRSWTEVEGMPVAVTNRSSLPWGIHRAGMPDAHPDTYVLVALMAAESGGLPLCRAAVSRYDGLAPVHAGWFTPAVIGRYGEASIDPDTYPDDDARARALEAAAAPLVAAALADAGLRDRWIEGATRLAALETSLPIWFKERGDYEAACQAEGFAPLPDEVLRTGNRSNLAFPVAPHENEKIAYDIHERRVRFLQRVTGRPADFLPARPVAAGRVGPWAVDITVGHWAFTTALEQAVARAVAHIDFGEPRWDDARSLAERLAEREPDFAYGPDTLPRVLAGLAGHPGNTAQARRPSDSSAVSSWRKPLRCDSRRDLADLLAWLDHLDPHWESRGGNYGGQVLQIHDHGVEVPAGGAVIFQDGYWGGLPRAADSHVLQAAQETARRLAVAFAPSLAGDTRQVLATAALASSRGGYGETLRVFDASGEIWASDGSLDHPALPARPFARSGGGTPRHAEIAADLARAACAWADGGDPPPTPDYPEAPEAISGFLYRPVRVGDPIRRDRHRYRVTRVRLLRADRDDISYFASPLADRVWTWDAVLEEASEPVSATR